MIRLSVIFGVIVGCQAPEPAPTELSDLSRYLFREWANPNPEVMADGVENLADMLADVNLTDGVMERSWTLRDIAIRDLHDVDWNRSRNPSDALGLGIAYASIWPVDDHSRMQTEADQLPAEPSATHYARTFPETTHPKCLVDASCPTLVTQSEITRKNILMTLDFELYKDIRWVATQRGDALAARSWIDRTWRGESGNTALHQSYSIDIWIPAGDGAWRYQTLWTESDVGLSTSDELVLATVTSAIDHAVHVQDEAIEALFH